MKTEAVFKRAFNDSLDVLATLEVGDELPSEHVLAARLQVSRTTVRKVLAALGEHGVLNAGGGRRIVGNHRSPRRFPEAETVPLSAQVEKNFMEWMLHDDPRPGRTISELELARHFGVATTGIREFLNRFQRFGLIEKRPNAGWLFKGFTRRFALELFEIRELFELRSAKAFGALPHGSPLWNQIGLLREEHEDLLAHVAQRYHDFSNLDNRFHRLINAASSNRFVDDFYDIITLIFHYHYQWNKRDERQRNEVAIEEHLAYIDALLKRNDRLIQIACRAHLASAKETLLRAIAPP